jgi:ribosomal protein S6
VHVYEGLIIFDSKEASSNWDNLKGQVVDILKKHGGEVLRDRKWSDRKLAHEIKGVKRGTYLLANFVCPPDAIPGIREDMKLAEPILRELIIRLDETKEAIQEKEAQEQAALAAEAAAAAQPTPTEEAPAEAKPETTETAEKPETTDEPKE